MQQDSRIVIPREEANRVEVKLSHNNWSEQFPYTPKVGAALWHDSDNLYLKFSVAEQAVLARVSEDNGEVWTDSCVEFFITFDEVGYYNFEFSCIGKMLLAYRKEKPSPQYATAEVMGMVERVSTLGSECFEEKRNEGGEDFEWEMSVRIPKEVFFVDSLTTLDGVSARANIYKCGDNLSVPHFISWAPIGTEEPNFHCPAFFGTLEFE